MRSRLLLLAVALLTVLVTAACAQPATVPNVQALATPAPGAETAAAPAASALTDPTALTETTISTAPVVPGAMSSMDGSGMEGMDHGAASNAGQPFDAQFIDSMIEHHQGAITMANLALEQAEHEALRSMAEAVISAQQAEIAQMQGWRAAWYPNLPPTAGMGMVMGDMELAGDASNSFDRRFLEAMISHHRGAIMMAESALTQAEHEEIRQLAQVIIDAQQIEIAQMHDWINAWYPGQAQTAPAAAGLEGTVWVANEAGNSLTVIDAATQSVVTTLTGIEGPHNVQVAPDGRTVWAVSGHDALAVAIDAQTYTLLGAVPVGNSPAHVIVSPDGATAWVSNSGDNTVAVIDTAAYTTVATIPVGEFPHGLRPSPDGKWIAVANMRSNTVSLIDTATRTPAATIPVGAGPVQVAFAPDGRALYVTLNGDDAVARIDPTTRTVVGTATVGDGPVQVYVTPDNRLVLVANQGSKDAPSTTLSIVDAATMREVAAVETGQGAHGVVVEPSGQYAYVTNLYGNSVAVVDLAERTVVATAPTGASPNGVSFSPLAPGKAAAEVILSIPANKVTGEGEASDTEGHAGHH